MAKDESKVESAYKWCANKIVTAEISEDKNAFNIIGRFCQCVAKAACIVPSAIFGGLLTIAGGALIIPTFLFVSLPIMGAGLIIASAEAQSGGGEESLGAKIFGIGLASPLFPTLPGLGFIGLGVAFLAGAAKDFWIAILRRITN